MIPFWSAVGHFEEEECEVEKEVDATEEEEILPRGNSILLRRSWKRKTVFQILVKLSRANEHRTNLKP